jgi:dipeptidyl aminopeptidase/acylaminoacyl peptidase
VPTLRISGALAVAFLLVLLPSGPATGSGAALRGKIAFSAGEIVGDIYTVRADGSHLRQLTRTELPEQSPTWSPDGKWIVYVGQIGRTGSGLFRMTSDGRQKSLLLREDESSHQFVADPAWSPDGRRIAFTSARLGDLRVWTIGLDGTLVMVTKTFGVMPTWSPDGRRLAYGGIGAGRRGTIFVIGSDGRGNRAVTDEPVDASYPVWSPDGKWIAFRSLNRDWRRHEVDSLVIVRPNGTSRRRLVRGGVVFPVAWSPASDAVLVVRAAAAPGSLSQLFAVPLDGAPARAVPGTYAAGDASWHR